MSNMISTGIGPQLKTAWALTKPYFCSEERWRARALLGGIISVNVVQIVLNIRFNAQLGRWLNAVQDLNSEAFFSDLFSIMLVIMAFVVSFIVEFGLTQDLIIRWRRWLTERCFDLWLGGQTYYRMQVNPNGTDNPDQRISEDVERFVRHALNLTVTFFFSVVNLASFIVILWKLSGTFKVPLPWGEVFYIPGYMVWGALLYAGVGTWLSHRVGHKLVALDFDQQRYEADFRFSLVRLRENAESIALYRGEEAERREFGRRFKEVIGNFTDIVRRKQKLRAVTSFYDQFAFPFPYLLAAPQYFARAIKYGGLMETVRAFSQVRGELSTIIHQYTTIADWRAVVNRLAGFAAETKEVGERRPLSGNAAPRKACLPVTGIAATARIGCDEKRDGTARQGIEIEKAPNGRLHVADLEVALPGGKPLFSGFRLDVMPGERVLISGPSGAGKSTLFRAIAGIWPYGRGAVVRPVEGSMFLPQKPYMPLGTLREAILYPYGADGRGDAEIVRVMRQVGLDKFTGRLDETRQWSHELSLGEQQRVAFARVLLRRPNLVFLDEATSALDEPREAALYGLLRETLPGASVVSIGHRRSLAALHDRRIVLNHVSEKLCA
ncbi:MAG: ABC transporter ATP-binding protein/permease [Deltaproteobacteria bacterium]|nr:ABC transporter ATP-binding protein/permease [Deltaproteobacteria bacterium]